MPHARPFTGLTGHVGNLSLQRPREWPPQPWEHNCLLLISSYPATWRFPKIGLPLFIIHVRLRCSFVDQPFFGYPHFRKAPNVLPAVPPVGKSLTNQCHEAIERWRTWKSSARSRVASLHRSLWAWGRATGPHPIADPASKWIDLQNYRKPFVYTFKM